MQKLTTKELLAMPGSEYMDVAQLSFFKHLLLQKQAETRERMEQARTALGELENPPDLLDLGSVELQRTLTLSTISRSNLALHDIDKALARISEETYGYCEMDGAEIGLERLLANPTAIYSTYSQQWVEARQATVRRSA